MIESTNYFDTFIEVAVDCPVAAAEVPRPMADAPTIASLQHAMISASPYRHTQDDVLFEVYATRQGIADDDKPAAREPFFTKDQPVCAHHHSASVTVGESTTMPKVESRWLRSNPKTIKRSLPMLR